MADILDMQKINSLPQPLSTEDGYYFETIDVQTGLVRVDVGGMIDFGEFSDFITIFDGDGVEHRTEDFYLD